MPRWFRTSLKRVAVFLDGNYRSSTGMGRTTLMLCDSMLKADTELTIVLASSMDSNEALSLIDEPFRSRIEVRRLMWAEGVDAQGMRWLRPQTIDGEGFLDCKVWFFFNLPAGGVVAPLRPGVMFCADLLVRIVPQAYHAGDMLAAREKWEDYLYHLLSYRQASLVFATSPRTRRDVISFAGVEQAGTCLAPQFPPLNEETEDRAAEIPFAKYFLWTSNDTPHKNHERAFEVLNQYYLIAGDEALPVVMTGPGTRWFNPKNLDSTHPYHVKIRSYISDKPHLIRNMYFPETLDRARFLAALKHASFLWHNVIYDNGTAAVLEAAEYHVPSLVSDYPQMRFFAEKYGVAVDYFSAFDIEDGVLALKKMTAECSTKRIAVSIDYTDENYRFRKWMKELLAASFAAKPSRGQRVKPLRIRPVSELLNENSAKIWPPLSGYLRHFPWQDVPVVGLIIAEDDSEKIIHYLSLFHTLLRKRFLDFKILLVLPNTESSLATARSYILARSLAFDFIYAGNVTNVEVIDLVKGLATYTFCDEVFADGQSGGKDGTFEMLYPAVTSTQQLNKVAGKIEAASAKLVARYVPSELRFFPRQASFVPELTPPPCHINFASGSYDRYLISGFYQMEDKFRWVTREARCLLGNLPNDSFAKRIFQNIRSFRNKNVVYLRIDSEVESLAFESTDAPPVLDVCLNGRSLGSANLKSGRQHHIFPLNKNIIKLNSINEIKLDTNFEYKAGGARSSDARIISWKLFSISLERSHVSG